MNGRALISCYPVDLPPSTPLALEFDYHVGAIIDQMVYPVRNFSLGLHSFFPTFI